MGQDKELKNDQFELFDLKIVVEKIAGNCTCNMAIGDCFYLKGGKLSIPDEEDFCLYAMQSTFPLLPAKQRINHPADWMETDSRIACPDPACGLIMRIDRLDKRVLNHDDVSDNNWEEIKKTLESK
jgi:uncharacterized repeat protein (TIGR04076 family)